MEEAFDIYDENWNHIGTAPRSEVHDKGLFHQVVHCWVIAQSEPVIYFQQRTHTKKDFPDCYDLSCGGHIDAGEQPDAAALREIREETGLQLDPARGKIIKTYQEDHFICDVWLFRQDFALEDVVLQPGETCDKRYATREEILKMHAEGRFVPFQFIEEVLDAQ